MLTSEFGLTPVNQPRHRAFRSEMEKSVSNAHGTGLDSYLFDSIFKSGGRLPHAATSLMDADRDRSYLREIAAFHWQYSSR